MSIEQLAGAPTGEDQLLEFTKAVERHKQGRHALHIKLSLLSPENSGSFASRNTASFFHILIKSDKGRLFRLSNADMVFVSSTADKADVDALQKKVTKFFDRDPHISDDPASLIAGFDLSQSYQSFLHTCQNLAADAQADIVPLTAPSTSDNHFEKDQTSESENVRSLLERAVNESGAARPKQSTLPRRLLFEDEEVKPISPADLDRLESNFRILDPSNLLVDMPVAAVIGDMQPHIIFSEKAIDYDALQAAVLPSRNMRGDANLFERIQCIIEQQLIKKLEMPASDQSLANSFPSNIKTVLSGDFIHFDRNHRRNSRVPLIVDIRLHDALMHMSEFLRMRRRVHEAGYRVCLSGMTTFGFAAMDHSHRLADFLKVSAPDQGNQLDTQWLEHFQDSARKAGNNRMIFTNCDTVDALETGRSLGFSLFQGQHINELITGEPSDATAAAYGL